ncbi:hypothetical protein M0638_00445 [Roseomonas sp. NAR14]|uniref:Uncharacterized protein n=1 Tax=Roseomonas acroporae TaxID=2937791 RepID=A0A9X2BS80_9PROT|nr:hypothetical protein [Roseomonas acroporae]MCK8782847.1 hypothetical protein [Roseomonas acroporae]
MQHWKASALGGLLGGLAMSLALPGRRGVTPVEEAGHLAASAGFGLAYGLLRRELPPASPLVLGSLYGAGLYAANLASGTPLLGLAEGRRGETAPAPPVMAERLGLHMLYGIVTALAADELESGRRRRLRRQPSI